MEWVGSTYCAQHCRIVRQHSARHDDPLRFGFGFGCGFNLHFQLRDGDGEVNFDGMLLSSKLWGWWTGCGG
jgi:hypothetical protein